MTAVQPTAVMSGRYQRAFTIAVVFLVGRLASRRSGRAAAA